MRSLPLLIAIALCPAPGAGAVDRFVDVNGSDTGNDCTVAPSPCRTITHAMSYGGPALILAGPGTYALGELFPLSVPDGVHLRSVTGAATTEILRTDPGGPSSITVDLRIDGSGSSKGIEGFTVNGSNLGHGYGVYLNSFAAQGAAPFPPPYIRDCRIQGFSAAAILAVTWGCCQGGTNELEAVIERNRILGSGTMDGIVVMAVAADAITRAADASLLRNNLVLRCRVGIHIGTAMDGITTPASHATMRTVVRHNTVFLSQTDAIQLASAEADPALATGVVLVELSNNIAADSAGYGIREVVGDSSLRWLEADPSILAANLVAGNALGGYFDADTARGYSSSNELNTIPDLGAGTRGNLALAPALQAGGGLTVASPAIDAGDFALSEAEDVDTNPRPCGRAGDIGADEVVVLLRGVFARIDPPSPSKPAVFAALQPYDVIPDREFVDPDPALASHAWIVYAAAAGAPGRIHAVKDRVSGSVRVSY